MGLGAGFGAHKSGAMRTLGPWLVRTVGWDVDAASAIDPERSLIIYHKSDGMIGYAACSMHKALEERKIKVDSVQLVRYSNSPQNAHMADLGSFGAKLADITTKVNNLRTKLGKKDN